jgi:N-acyl homoserine lactone hydrolase
MTNVSRISVLSTGAVRIRPQHVRATGSPLPWWLLTSRSWTAPLPINVYVIEHRDGLVLFDTGQDRASVSNPSYFPKGVTGQLYARLANFEIAEQQTLSAQLRSIGYDPRDVTTAVLSHLHQDHIGGIAELPNAEIVVSAREWAQVGRLWAALDGILSDHIRMPGVKFRLIDTEPVTDASIAPFTSAFDLRNDGSLMLLPTPGHTPGSLSLLVRTAALPPLLLVGDLTYDVSLLPGEHVPGVGQHATLVATTRKVNALKQLHPELVVLAAHDPAAAGLLEAALAKATK